jgi:hypothetical protein
MGQRTWYFSIFKPSRCSIISCSLRQQTSLSFILASLRLWTGLTHGPPGSQSTHVSDLIVLTARDSSEMTVSKTKKKPLTEVPVCLPSFIPSPSVRANSQIHAKETHSKLRFGSHAWLRTRKSSFSFIFSLYFKQVDNPRIDIVSSQDTLISSREYRVAKTSR